MRVRDTARRATRLMRRARRVSASGVVGRAHDWHARQPTSRAPTRGWCTIGRSDDRLPGAAVPLRAARLRRCSWRRVEEPLNQSRGRARDRAVPRRRQRRGAGHLRPRGHRFGAVAGSGTRLGPAPPPRRIPHGRVAPRAATDRSPARLLADTRLRRDCDEARTSRGRARSGRGRDPAQGRAVPGRRPRGRRGAGQRVRDRRGAARHRRCSTRASRARASTSCWPAR